MSELQAQVSRLREVHSYSKPMTSGRASLFVSDSEAAGIDTEAVYEACVGALATLSQYDSRLRSYLDTILHPSSVTLQRDLKTAEENKVLDQQLNALLDHLSLFAAEHETHVVLEYLIRRYRVNEVNSDHLLRCMISYHDSKIFARVVQHSNIKGHWSFLSGVKSSGSPLPRSVIVGICKKDSSILSCLSDVVLTAMNFSTTAGSSAKVLAGFSRILSFFTATMLEVCEGSTLSDQHARELIPFLNKGVSLPKENLSRILADKDHIIHQFRRSCLMIIIQFSRTNRLSQQLVFSFVKSMITCLNLIFSQIDSDDLQILDFGFAAPHVTEILSSLVVLSQFQEVVFTRTLVKSAFLESKTSPSSLGPLLGALQGFQGKCDLTNIIRAASDGLFSEYQFGAQQVKDSKKGGSVLYCDAVETVLTAMISNGMLNSDQLAPQVLKLLSAYSDVARSSDSSESKPISTSIVSIMQIISQRFPNMFDNCVREMLTNSEYSDSLRPALGAIYGASTHRLPSGGEDSGLNLALSLAHPSPHLRLEAIKTFESTVFTENEANDLQGLVDTLLLSINDVNEEIRLSIWKESVLSKAVSVLTSSALLELLTSSWTHWATCPSFADRVTMIGVILSSLSFRTVVDKLAELPEAVAWCFKVISSCLGGLFNSSNDNSMDSSSSSNKDVDSIIRASCRALEALSASIPCFANILPSSTTQSKSKSKGKAVVNDNEAIDLQEVYSKIADNLLSIGNSNNFYSLTKLIISGFALNVLETEAAWCFASFLNAIRLAINSKSSQAVSSKKSAKTSSDNVQLLVVILCHLVVGLIVDHNISEFVDVSHSIIISLIGDAQIFESLPVRNGIKTSELSIELVGHFVEPAQASSLFYRLLLCLLQTNELADLVGLLLSKVPLDIIPEVLLKVVLSENAGSSVSISSTDLSTESSTLLINMKARSNAMLALSAFLEAQLLASSGSITSLQAIHLIMTLPAIILSCTNLEANGELRAAAIKLASKVTGSTATISTVSLKLAGTNDAVNMADVIEVYKVLLNDSSAIALDSSVTSTVLSNRLSKAEAKTAQIFRPLVLIASLTGWSFPHISYALFKPLERVKLSLLWSCGLSSFFQVRKSTEVVGNKNDLVNFSALLCRIASIGFKDSSADLKSEVVSSWISLISKGGLSNQQLNSAFYLHQAILQSLSDSVSIIEHLSEVNKNSLFKTLIDQQIKSPGDRSISDVITKIFVSMETAEELVTSAFSEYKSCYDSEVAKLTTSTTGNMILDNEDDDNLLFVRMSGALSKVTTSIESVVHCIQAGVTPVDDPHFASIALTLMDLFLLNSNKALQLASAVESAQVLFLETISTCLKMSAAFISSRSDDQSKSITKAAISNKKTPSKPTSSSSSSSKYYSASRVASDSDHILSTVVSAKSPQLQTASLAVLERLIQLNPTALASTIESLGKILSNATRQNLFSSNLLLEKTLKTMISLSSDSTHKTAIFPQDITSSLLLHVGALPNAQRINLIDAAMNGVGVYTLPVVVQCLLIHVLHSYNPTKVESETGGEQMETDENDSKSANAQSFILLSRASQKRAFKALKASSSEELFHLSVNYTASLPAILQVSNLIFQIKTARRIFENVFTHLTGSSSGDANWLVSHDHFNADLKKHGVYFGRLASDHDAKNIHDSILPLGLVIMEFITESLQNKSFHKMLALSGAHASAASNNADASGKNASQKADSSIQVYFLVLVEHLLELLSFASNLQQYAQNADAKKVNFNVVMQSTSNIQISCKAFGRTLWNQIMVILEHMQRVLDGPTFIQILEELLNHQDASVRQRAISILSQRLESMSLDQKNADYEVHLFLDLVVKLRESLKTTLPLLINNEYQDSSSSAIPQSEHPQLGLAQSSILCIDSIARYLVGASVGNVAADAGADASSNVASAAWKEKVMMATLIDIVNISVTLQKVTNATELSIAKASRASATPSKATKKSKSDSSDNSVDTTAPKLANMNIASYLGLMKLLGSAYLCGGTLCGVVGPKSLVVLSKITEYLLASLQCFSSPTWLSSIIELFDLTSTTSTSPASATSRTRVLVIRSIVSSISAVVKYLPGFVHPYLLKIFSLLFSLGQPTDGLASNDSEQIIADVDNCLHVICEKVSGRLLMPALLSSAPELLAQSPYIAWNFGGFMKLYIGGIDRTQLTQFLSSLCTLLTMLFDYRRVKRLANDDSSSGGSEDIESLIAAYDKYNVDNIAVEAAVELCLKLTEPELHLYLSRLAEWKDISFDSLDGNWRHVSRRKVFYAFMATLSSKLSTLFIPFMETNWSHSIASLQEYLDFSSFYGSLSRSSSKSNSKKEKKRKQSLDGSGDDMVEFKEMSFDSRLGNDSKLFMAETTSISQHILDTIRSCCQNDINNGIDQTRYESLMAPLVGCLSAREAFASDESFYEHCSDHVINTIAAFAKAIQKDVIWKPLNHRLLLLTRSKLSCVKIVAVLALRRLFEEVGDEYLLLLPECLPYISELLEDDDRKVVAETSKTVKIIEELSGEELDSYLQ